VLSFLFFGVIVKEGFLPVAEVWQVVLQPVKKRS